MEEEYGEKDIKEEILSYFGEDKPEEDKVALFAKMLFDEIISLDDYRSYSKHHKGKKHEGIDPNSSLAYWTYLCERIEEGDKKKRLRKRDSEKLFAKFKKFKRDYNEIKSKLLGKEDRFLLEASRKYHLDRGEIIKNPDGGRKKPYKWTRALNSKDHENGIVPFAETVRQFEDGMNIIMEVMELELASHDSKSGRPKSLYTPYDIFISKMCVLCDCLLGLEIKKTNNETDTFYLVMSLCINLAKGQNYETVVNVAREIEVCFTDYLMLHLMGEAYNGLGRLDLYIEHVKRTPRINWIADYFEDEWADWEKPDNYQSLISMTKTA